MTKREEVAMNSPEREEVSRQLAKEFVYAIDDEGDWYRCPLSESRRVCVPKGIRDALISREMRVRELEAVIRELRINNSKLGLKICDLALNSKGDS